MNQSTLSVRVDSEDKKYFEIFCNNTGMNVSTAINMFIKTVLREQRIPFEIKTDNLDKEIYSKLLEADQELENNKKRYTSDEVLESMKEIDRFFDEQSEENGIIGKNRGQILFSLGSYIGQTIINLYGGEWITDDSDPNGEVNITVKLKNDSTILTPVIRCLKRYTNGKEDSIYAYVYAFGEEKKNI